MKLPQKLSWDMSSTPWASAIEPVINSPIATPTILKNVALVTGKNVINHLLGRRLEGWLPTRVRSASTFYDGQDSNQTPNLTLVLYSSAPCTIDLMVF